MQDQTPEVSPHTTISTEGLLSTFPCLSCPRLGHELPPLDRPAEDVTPPVIPGYELLGPRWAGGMGIVFKANQLCFHRDVALKVLPPNLEWRGPWPREKPPPS